MKNTLLINEAQCSLLCVATSCSKASELEVEYPHYVSFTPEGQLISCQSSSHGIYIWPAVDILWSTLPDHENIIMSESFFTIDDIKEIQR
jgi:hypothetical protein